MRSCEIDGLAAANNASWCDAVCRANGVVAASSEDLWWSSTRTLPLYPDAVTLRQTVSAEQVVSAIDGSAGASVKDSFACLDLTAYGFFVLFDARWVSWEAVPLPAPDTLWRGVTTPDALATWVDTHGDGPPLPPALLRNPRVTLLAADADQGTGSDAVCGGRGRRRGQPLPGGGLADVALRRMVLL